MRPSARLAIMYVPFTKQVGTRLTAGDSGPHFFHRFRSRLTLS